MKSKILKTFFKFIPVIALPLSTASILTSCQKEHVDIEKIDLNASRHYALPGERLQIEKTIAPVAAQSNRVSWRVIDAPFGVYITEKGVLVVEKGVYITDPIIVNVIAYDPTNEEVFNTISIVISPSAKSNFLGFLNGELYCKDRYSQDKVIKINQTSNNVYETEDYVDFFATDQTPSKITFVPTFKDHVNELMKFHLAGGTSVTHSIDWDNYEDNTWTSTIPAIKPITPYVQSDTIEVTFECDPSVIFKIKCWTWATRGTSVGTVAYSSTIEGDIHGINPVGVGGKFSIDLYRQESQKQDTLQTLLFYEPKYQYLDYRFKINFDGIKEEVKKIIEPQVSDTLNQIKFAYRPFDRFPYYYLDNLSLDFSNDYFKPATPLGDRIKLFQLLASDPMGGEENVSFTLDVYMDWL